MNRRRWVGMQRQRTPSPATRRASDPRTVRFSWRRTEVHLSCPGCGAILVRWTALLIPLCATDVPLAEDVLVIRGQQRTAKMASDTAISRRVPGGQECRNIPYREAVEGSSPSAPLALWRASLSLSKVRDRFEVDAAIVQAGMEEHALGLAKVQASMEGRAPRKFGAVPPNLVNVAGSRASRRRPRLRMRSETLTPSAVLLRAGSSPPWRRRCDRPRTRGEPAAR